MNNLEYGSNDIDGYTVIIEQDTDYESPREWDNLGTMYCEHNRYNLGDKDAEDIRETDQPFKGVVLPLYLYDHSGLSMSTGSFIGRAQHADWDSGEVGYIYVTDERIRQEYNVKRISKQIRAKVIACLISEVKTYDQCLRGDVYGYVIQDPNKETVESCWGFYGDEDVKEQAWGALQYIIDQDRLNRIDQVKTWIRNHVPLSNRHFCL